MLTPRTDDPNFEQQMQVRKRSPELFGPSNMGQAATAGPAPIVDARPDSKKVAEAKQSAKEANARADLLQGALDENNKVAEETGVAVLAMESERALHIQLIGALGDFVSENMNEDNAQVGAGLIEQVNEVAGD